MVREYINPSGIAEPPDPYTHVVRAGDVVYIAGQVARDELGRVVGVGDPRKQAEQCWKNLELAVKAAGGTLESIVKITAFLKSIDDSRHEIDVRTRLFEEHRFPICTLVQVAQLARPEFLMEIDAIAVLE